ncbi:MAG: ATP-grasp domain-containing protein, partial [Candidatus Eisenbacteria bacterium]|nr:ATP-grasp domain-containing protein [Candidatus Eisenbacteria bacterium]
MRNVVFVAPFFLATTIRFLESVLSLENVRVGLVSQDPINKLPGNLRGRLAADWRVADALDANHLVPAVQGLATKMGGVERLVGALEELQVPLAQVRERLRIPGLSVEAAQNFRDKSRMKTVLQENGLPCAKHALARSADEARKLIDDLGFPVIAKPPDGAGARGTYRLEDANAFQEFVHHFPISERRPVLFEEFIQGEEHSFDSVMVDGQPV